MFASLASAERNNGLPHRMASEGSDNPATRTRDAGNLGLPTDRTHSPTGLSSAAGRLSELSSSLLSGELLRKRIFEWWLQALRPRTDRSGQLEADLAEAAGLVNLTTGSRKRTQTVCASHLAALSPSSSGETSRRLRSPIRNFVMETPNGATSPNAPLRHLTKEAELIHSGGYGEEAMRKRAKMDFVDVLKKPVTPTEAKNAKDAFNVKLPNEVTPVNLSWRSPLRQHEVLQSRQSPLAHVADSHPRGKEQQESPIDLSLSTSGTPDQDEAGEIGTRDFLPKISSAWVIFVYKHYATYSNI
ncbi:unnamed protein product [Protopolystoma xenopodis]|uniref:Uncharacterized protein n=1 Tax=Protopolystoma xenopodis TaxID=117903 RepID=A0A3S5FGB9_9PLAT|nr:unnamed protein product [Protopolystoma xenopodis]